MMTARHVLVLLWSVLRFACTTRNVAVLVVVVGGLVLLVAALSAQAAAPFVLYPFA